MFVVTYKNESIMYFYVGKSYPQNYSWKPINYYELDDSTISLKIARKMFKKHTTTYADTSDIHIKYVHN